MHVAEGSASGERLVLGAGPCALLEAGEQLAYTLPLSFSPVRLAAVCARAKVAPSVAYTVWSSQEEFDRDLMHFLLDSGRMRTPTKTFDLALALLENEDTTLDELIRCLAPANLALMASGKTFHNFIAVVPARDDAEARRALREYVDGYRPVIHRIFRLGFVMYRRRLRRGVCLDTLFALLQGLAHGFAIRNRVVPALTYTEVDRDGKPWHLAALAVEALVLASTEPKP